MLAAADAEGNGVLVAAAETDDALDPGKVLVALAGVDVGGEGGGGGVVGAAGEDLAGVAGGVRVGDDEAALAGGHVEGVRGGLGGGPRDTVVDAERDGEDRLDRGRVAGRDGQRVLERVAIGHGDERLVDLGGDDRRHGHVPLLEVGLVLELDLGGLLAVGTLAVQADGGGEVGGGLDGGRVDGVAQVGEGRRRGNVTLLESVVVGGLHDGVEAVVAEDDDIVLAEDALLEGSLGGKSGGDGNEAEKSGLDVHCEGECGSDCLSEKRVLFDGEGYCLIEILKYKQTP